jgi:DNA-binding transcriptional regulator YhcF (GntR family)
MPPPEAVVDDRSGASGFYITRRGSVEYIVKTCGASAFAVYSYLLQCANHQTGRCDPAQRTISDKLSMSKITVNAALSALVTEGIIAAKQDKSSKFASTKWILKDIGTECRRHLRASAQYQNLVQDQYQEMVQEPSLMTLPVYQNLDHAVPESGTEIEEGNIRREERDSLSSSSSKTHRESAVVQDLTKSGSGEPPASSQKPPVPREEKLRRAEFVVAALFGDIKGVPGSTWGFVNKQLGALEWPPEEDLDGFVKWWRSEFPAIKLTLGAISPKNWPAYLAHKANSAPKYIPRTWQGD